MLYQSVNTQCTDDLSNVATIIELHYLKSQCQLIANYGLITQARVAKFIIIELTKILFSVAQTYHANLSNVTMCCQTSIHRITSAYTEYPINAMEPSPHCNELRDVLRLALENVASSSLKKESWNQQRIELAAKLKVIQLELSGIAQLE